MMDRISKNILFHAPWLLSDKRFLELCFEWKMGYRPDLDNPRTFNEKLQWLKLHDRRPEYTSMVDKASAKDIAAPLIGQEHIIPTIGIYDSVEEIPWESLPERFVLKCTHDSGGVVICTDKSRLNRKEAADKLHRSLHRNFYRLFREWPYKDIKPRIICESYMGDLTDYKWFCFDGTPRFMFIATDRNNDEEETKFDFFDCSFNHLAFTNGHPNAERVPARPQSWEEMIRLASILSKGLRHVRIDFYEVDGRIYFGEFTFYHWAGFVPFSPDKWDLKIGEMIKL